MSKALPQGCKYLSIQSVASSAKILKMKHLTAVIKKDGSWFVAENPETGVTSQGKTENEALANLREAVELYLEEANVSRIPKVTVRPLNI